MNVNVNPFNQWGDGSETESHELNERVPINQNPNTYMTGDGREVSVESLNIDTMQSKEFTGNGEIKRSYFNEVPTEGSYAQAWKYSEQIKSILAGLLLLTCGGMHTVWAIYQVLFHKTSELYREDLNKIDKKKWPERYFEVFMFSEKVGLMFTIVMWYIGMAVGCFVAGWYLIPHLQKRNVYYLAALVMFASGCIFYSSDVAYGGWQTILLFGRLVAGLAHGITYVTVFVQASENASKDFRRIIVTIIGVTIGLSIFFASTFFIYIPTPERTAEETKSNVTESSERMSSGIMATVTIILCFLSVVLNYFFSHETAPFLLYHNYREEEAQFAIARLIGEDQAAPIVQQEFEAIRELCNDDYAQYPEGKIFTTIHRRLMTIAISSRITSAQCFYMLYVIMFVRYIQSVFSDDVETIERDAYSKNLTEKELVENLAEIINMAKIYSIAVRSAIASWFIFGVPFILIGNYFNWKRGLHFTTFLVGTTMVLFVLCHKIGIFGEIFRHFVILFFTIYTHFLSLPIDTLGYSYLMECFPISTKSRAIAFVTVCECMFNSVFIWFDMEHRTLGIEYIGMGLIFSILGLRLYAIVPNTNGLSLGAAKYAYLQALSTNWWEFYKKN